MSYDNLWHVGTFVHQILLVELGKTAGKGEWEI